MVYDAPLPLTGELQRILTWERDAKIQDWALVDSEGRVWEPMAYALHDDIFYHTSDYQHDENVVIIRINRIDGYGLIQAESGELPSITLVETQPRRR